MFHVLKWKALRILIHWCLGAVMGLSARFPCNPVNMVEYGPLLQTSGNGRTITEEMQEYGYLDDEN